MPFEPQRVTKWTSIPLLPHQAGRAIVSPNSYLDSSAGFFSGPLGLSSDKASLSLLLSTREHMAGVTCDLLFSGTPSVSLCFLAVPSPPLWFWILSLPQSILCILTLHPALHSPVIICRHPPSCLDTLFSECFLELSQEIHAMRVPQTLYQRLL